MMRRLLALVLAFAASGLSACDDPIEADILIENGAVFVGGNVPAQPLVVAIKGEDILYVGPPDTSIAATTVIDARGRYVVPGFIDPHTHSLGELTSEDAEIRANRNYQFQGVTTVINGNDGFGTPGIADQLSAFSANGIGTNTALFIGHGALRKQVMGGAKRPPTAKELEQMQAIMTRDMKDGALGLSTGLFYAPGSFSNTQEVIALAKTAAAYGGVYDSHIRDESTYNIGLQAAIAEVIEIAREAGIHANIAHIKALGVDVWGKSAALINMIEAAQDEGLSISADHYPWQASGTRISNALLPRWVKAGSAQDYQGRLSDPELAEQLLLETKENLRRRGGPDAVLITQDKADWKGKTLTQIADETGLQPAQMAIKIAQMGDARIASFNMSMDDVLAFMAKEWVMTSSDGSTGHPRKYATYPKKYRDYVIAKGVMPIETFFYRSAGLVADTFQLCGRGYLKPGYKADIAIIDPQRYAPIADYQNPAALAQGVDYLLVNGALSIAGGDALPDLNGKALKRCKKGK